MPRTAVFDFDNTCIFHDAGEAVLREQLRRRWLRLSVDALADHLPLHVNGKHALATGQSFAALRDDLLDDYRALRAENISPTDGAPKMNDALVPIARDFTARLGGLYSGMESTPGIGAEVAYPWLCGLLAGFDDDETKALALHAWNRAAVEPIGRRTLVSRPGRAGPTAFTFATGVRVQEEMHELFSALVSVDVTPMIVTASEQGLIRALAPSLGLEISPDAIFGMVLNQNSDGTRATTLHADFPQTYRRGKAETIAQRIVGQGRVAPVLVAGDSDTDFEMLTGFPETEIRLVIHRRHDGDIASLFDDEETLLQGRDENKGHFIPSHRTRFYDDVST